MNIFTDGTATLNDSSALMKIYEGVKHTEISEEFILPDYLPDIKRIIRVDATPKIDGKFITSGKIEYEGDVICHLLFCDDENRLKTVTFTSAFSDRIELDGTDDECIANLIPTPESISCRMINPRRISLRLRLDTDATIWCKRSFTPEISGKYSPAGCETLTKNVEVMELICAGESGLNASADLEADGALPQIGEVISCNVDMSFYECKGSDGRVLCRGDMPVTIFYSTPQVSDPDTGTVTSETYTVLYRKLPIAQVVGAEGVDESYDCMARGSIDDIKVTVSENGFGERRILELDVTYRIYLNCVGRSAVTLTEDMYAVDRDVSCVKKKSTFCRFSRSYSSAFSSNLALTRDELNVSDADSIFEVSAHPKVTEVTLSDDNRKLIVRGHSLTSAILHGADGLFSVDYQVPFSVELDPTGVPAEFIYNSDTVCMSARGRLDGEKLYTELEMQINLMILGVSELTVLERAELTEKADIPELPEMRFFYPEEGETLWDIGKQFGVSRKALSELNELTDESVPEMLFIPTKKVL